MVCVGAQNVGAMAVFTRPRLKPLVGRRVMPRKKQSFWRMSSMKVKCNSSSGSDSCVVDKEDFADEEDYIKAGGSQLVFVQMQQKKDMDQQSKLSDELRQISAGQTVLDLVVIGCGPAGLALAAESAKLGLNVALVGPDLPFTNNYGVWEDEFKDLGLQACIEHVWRDTIVYLDDDEPILIGRAYGRVSRHFLHEELLKRCVEAGVLYLNSKVDRIVEATNGQSLVECEGNVVIPCRFVTVASGAASGKFLQYELGGPRVSVQTAYGVEVEVDNNPRWYRYNSLSSTLIKPPDISLLQNALHKLQNSNPILKSQLHFESSTNSYSYIIPSTCRLQIQPFDLSSTVQILRRLKTSDLTSVSDFHLILEHEINHNSWINTGTSSDSDTDIFFASIYQLEDEKSVFALRIHTSVCDRAAALAVLKKLLKLVSCEKEDEEGIELEILKKMEVGLGIEEYIPDGKASKPFWARGIDMVGYGLNSLRFCNLKFIDSESTRGSQVVKLQLNKEETDHILDGCKTKGIKLCGLLAAAGLIAAHSSKGLKENQWEKYAIVTLINCRSILDPVLSPDFPGFYHSAILNTHDVKGGDDLWELAKRSYTSFINAKNNNKHFTDMGDLNFLMCRAIDNPGLTPSSSLRTSLISVFEDTVIDTSSTMHQEIGLEDFIGCASVHGVGPSIAIFDTIRDGHLDCACVYPFPLHTREQIQELIGEMKKILIDC